MFISKQYLLVVVANRPTTKPVYESFTPFISDATAEAKLFEKINENKRKTYLIHKVLPKFLN